MRWLAFAAIAAFLAAAATLAVVQERDDDRDQTAVREFSEAWRLSDVGRDGRSLRLSYDGGGCAQGHARAIVRESRSRVRIEVRQRYTVAADASAETFCTADLKAHNLVARLDRPIAGRHIEGSAPIDSGIWRRAKGRRDFPVIGIPRVVGLAAGDAVELLGYQRFRARLQGSTVGRVVSQRPRPGTPVRLRTGAGPLAMVTLTLRRHPPE